MDPGLGLQNPLLLAIAALIASAAVVGGWRAAMPCPARWLALVTLGLLVLATGRPLWQYENRPTVAVMLDLTPSTRGAAWRELATLQGLIDSLSGRATVRLYSFPDAAPLDLAAYEGADQGTDEPALQFPGSIDAAILLTDGQAPPVDWSNPPPQVVWVVDPVLDAPPDATVTRLTPEGSTVRVEARAGVAPAQLEAGGRNQAFGGSILLHIEPSPDRPLVARVNTADDRWPENDALRLPPIPSVALRRLWVGANAPPGFDAVAALPADAAVLADASVVVLSNVPANALSQAAGQALRQYVTDLGGTLLLLGGDRAFSAGGWDATVLEDLSPLASRPPRPRQQWVLLIDASGSMARADAGATRFVRALSALRQSLAALPAGATLNVGSFAAELHWWVREASPSQAARTRWPPDGLAPGGETNLSGALSSLTRERGEEPLPTQVLILTDAEAPLESPDALARALVEANITLHVLLLGEHIPPEVQQLVDATGGHVVLEPDPQRWGEAAKGLACAAAGDELVAGPAELHLTGELADLGPLLVPFWNRTWPREDTRLFSAAEPAPGPAAAAWHVGLGRVLAFAGPLPNDTAGEIAQRFEARPSDERWIVDWEDGPNLRVRVEGPAETVELRRDGQTYSAEHVGPDQFVVRVPAPRQPAVAALIVDGTVVERRATAGRYPPEFEGIGNDRNVLHGLSQPGDLVINLPDLSAWSPVRPKRHISLLLPLVLTAALTAACTLLLWQRG